MTKPSPARYRTTNWSDYNASLTKRDLISIWLDKEMIWLAPHDGSPGRPAVLSDAVTPQMRVTQQRPIAASTPSVNNLLLDGGSLVARFKSQCT